VVLFIKEIVPWTLNTRYYHVGTIGYRVLHVIVPWTLNRFPKIPEPLYGDPGIRVKEAMG
jgi:hypothetical protein